MRSSIEIVELDAKAVLGRQRAKIENLWRLVFPETTNERFAEILPRHVERHGFRFLAARADDATLAGFAYGYLGGPGECWHDRVSAALGPELTRRWLPPGHFEFVELQVHPDFRRRGIGRRLHNALLDSTEGPDSCSLDPARQLGSDRAVRGSSVASHPRRNRLRRRGPTVPRPGP
jgi:GNAT superfamily N-acetyltransferase